MELIGIVAVVLLVTGYVGVRLFHTHEYETSWLNRKKYVWTATACAFCGKPVSYDEAENYYYQSSKR